MSVGGNAVSYASADSLNPTGWAGRSYGYEGRRLTSFCWNGRNCVYSYDDQSRRIKKVVNGITTRYYYSGDLLICEDGANGRLDFLYDENGQLYGFIKDNGNKYFYVKDILGTILGIVNEDGYIVAKYDYSAFGECTIKHNTSNIAEINPFRFKCYYYDNESGMYYCLTRYLVPEWGRWLNADSPNFLEFDNINGMNLFAYCAGNPVNCYDPTGQGLLASILIGALIGAIFGGIEGGISAKMAGRDVAGGIVFGALGGAVLGGVAGGLGINYLTGKAFADTIIKIGLLSVVVGGIIEFANQKINGEDFDLGRIVWAGVKSATTNMASLAFGNYVGKFAKDVFDIFGTTLGATIIFFGGNLLFDLIDIKSYRRKEKNFLNIFRGCLIVKINNREWKIGFLLFQILIIIPFIVAMIISYVYNQWFIGSVLIVVGIVIIIINMDNVVWIENVTIDEEKIIVYRAKKEINRIGWRDIKKIYRDNKALASKESGVRYKLYYCYYFWDGTDSITNTKNGNEHYVVFRCSKKQEHLFSKFTDLPIQDLERDK